MTNYKHLKVWQKSIEMVSELYKATRQFPKEEKFGLISQMQRSAVSIPSNIAEGCGRNSDKELIQFLSIALGSAFELETQLIISSKLNYITDVLFKNLSTSILEIQRMLYSLKLKIESKLKG
jgi:four helix bundle protein